MKHLILYSPKGQEEFANHVVILDMVDHAGFSDAQWAFYDLLANGNKCRTANVEWFKANSYTVLEKEEYNY